MKKLDIPTGTDLPDYYSPRISSEVDDCALPLTFDSYSRCSLGCRFCFSNTQKDNNPVLKEAPFQGINPKKILSLIDGTGKSKEAQLFYKHFFSKRFIFHWGGLADPFCRFEKKYGNGYVLMKELAERKYPTLFSFKGSSVMDDHYLKLFQSYAKNFSFSFQTSIVTADDELAKYVEPGVPSPTRRYEAMKTLSDMGYWTILRLRPFIIGVTDLSLDEILEKGLQAGMKAVSTEFYAIDSRVNEWSQRQYDEMGKLTHVDNILEHFKALSPSERGGYMRQNRNVKENHIRKIYEFCAKHNLEFASSDPDFKEMSTCSCCCGIPDKNPDNPEFENFTTNQMTHAIKEARRHYHRTGEIPKLYFDEVYKGFGGFLDSIDLSHQNIGCTSHVYAFRKRLTMRNILQSKWNNLRSFSNPRNYFHGKVRPDGLDDNDNYIYKYKPSPFEERWKEAGIDMTR